MPDDVSLQCRHKASSIVMVIMDGALHDNDVTWRPEMTFVEGYVKFDSDS